MDDRLKKALDFSNYMITLDNQKRILKEKYQEDLLYYYGGGTFVATKELITFCYSMISYTIRCILRKDFVNELQNKYCTNELRQHKDYTNNIYLTPLH